jgi:hypothetical protein
MKKSYRILFVLLGSVLFILTLGHCFPVPVVTDVLPPTGSLLLHSRCTSFSLP